MRIWKDIFMLSRTECHELSRTAMMSCKTRKFSSRVIEDSFSVLAENHEPFGRVDWQGTSRLWSASNAKYCLRGMRNVQFPDPWHSDSQPPQTKIP